MNYRELMDRCKSQPGWITHVSQHKIESDFHYSDWVKKMNKNASTKKDDKKN